MKKIIAFDVDNTVVNAGERFSEFVMDQQWFRDYFSCKEQAREMAFGNYNISNYNFFKPKHKKIMNDFWKSETLYDSMEVEESAEELIHNLMKRGHYVIFVTHVEGIHAKSKFEMLKRAFGELDSFIATREKNFIRCDFLIDDRAYNLMNLHPETQGIYVKTSYSDDSKHLIDCPEVEFGNMMSIYDLLVS